MVTQHTDELVLYCVQTKESQYNLATLLNMETLLFFNLK